MMSSAKRSESRNKSRPSLSRFGKQKKAAASISINPDLIYAEREIWSPQHAIWERFAVRLPRLPTDEDRQARWVDDPANSPRSFQGYVGGHNQDYFNSLNNYIDLLEQAKSLPDTIVITGPSGSGKSSSVRILMDRFSDAMNLASHQFGKWCLFLDAKKFTEDFNMMWGRIERFGDAPMEKFIAAKFRLLVVDNFEAIPPSAQQIFKKSMMTLGPKLRYVFVCNSDPRTSMIAYMLGKGTVLRTRAIAERDALSAMLSIIARNKVGYELEGIQAVFSMHSSTFSCSDMLDLLQKVFVQEHFVSEANVFKAAKKPMDPPQISQTTVLEPLARCEICTLMPPCQHITEKFMHTLGIQRRKELPRYRDGSMTCPEFARYGHCSFFNNYGVCSLDHPKNLHKVVKPLRRCEQCTIPWPCNHCAYSAYRNNLMSVAAELHLRIGRLRQINVPDPPLAFLKVLVSMSLIGRKMIILILLTYHVGTGTWLASRNTAYRPRLYETRKFSNIEKCGGLA